MRSTKFIYFFLFIAGLIVSGAISRPQRVDAVAGQSDQITVAVDSSFRPTRNELPGFDRESPARPLAALIGPKGRPVDFVENELTLVTDDAAVLNSFLSRWGGKLIKSVNPREFRLEGASVHLVRIDTSLTNESTFLTDLKKIAPAGSHGHHRVSSKAGLHLLAAAAREAADGLKVGVSWVGKSDDYVSRETAEAPSGPSAPGCCPNEFGPGGYSPNAFDWKTLNTSPVGEFGVTEAWRMLSLADKFGNKVKLAVLDGGFLQNADYPDTTEYWSPFAFNANGTPGVDDAWHGTKVVGAGMAVPNNSFGAAGPAGPVAHPLLMYTFNDPFSSSVAILNAVGKGARIINMSYHWTVPAVFSASMLPFDFVTGMVRDSGVLIYASAGNDGEDVDETDCFGACWEEEWWAPCENSGVTCVGGLSAGSLFKAASSNYGTDGQVEIYAPFTLLVGPDETPNSNIAQVKNGTSYSSPYVAGVAALIWAANPNLTGDQVHNLLFTHAGKNSPDKLVYRYVHAASAVHAALGNVPPAIKIVKPTLGQQAGVGGLNMTKFEAAVDDYDDGAACCDVTWTSTVDGVMGKGVNLDFTFSKPGVRVITATAKDSDGATATDTLILKAVGDPPQVMIVKPTSGQTIYKGFDYVFNGDSIDYNEPLLKLPCNSMKWTSSNPADPFPKIGCNPTVNFPTTGARTITLTGTDSDGLKDTASVTIAVTNPPANSPPIVTILNPKDNGYFDHSETVLLIGKADDPDNQGPITYEWKIKYGNTVKTIFQGSAGDAQSFLKTWKPSNDVPSDCGGWPVRLYLYATDAGGKTGAAYIDIYVAYPVC